MLFYPLINIPNFYVKPLINDSGELVLINDSGELFLINSRENHLIYGFHFFFSLRLHVSSHQEVRGIRALHIIKSLGSGKKVVWSLATIFP